MVNNLVRAPGGFSASSRTWLALFLLFAIALTPRLALIWWNDFDGLYGQDSYAYLHYAEQMYTALSKIQLPPPFWWPMGYPALLSLAFLLLGAGVHSAQTITMLTGAIAAPLTFLLTREAFNGPNSNLAGFVAGGLVALGGQLVQSSISIMSDAPALMWATLSAWLLLRYFRSFSQFSLSVSALAMGLAVVSRWENIGFLIAWTGALVAHRLSLAFRGTKSVAPEGRKNSWWNIPASLAFGLIPLVPQLFYKFVYSAPLAGESWLAGWTPANFLSRSFDTLDGHFYYALPVSVFYGQVLFHPAFIFPLFTAFVGIGALLLARRWHRDPSIAVLLIGWIVVMYLFLAGIPYENFRFGLGYFVPAAILAGGGLAWTWGKMREMQNHAPTERRVRLLYPFASHILVVAIVIGFVGSALWEPRVLQPVLAEKQMELAQVEWLSTRLPVSSSLYTFGVTEALRNYSAFEITDLSEESPEQVLSDVRGNNSAFLFVDVANIEAQWHEMELEKTLHTLEDRGGLVEVGKLDRFTLYHMKGTP